MPLRHMLVKHFKKFFLFGIEKVVKLFDGFFNFR